MEVATGFSFSLNPCEIKLFGNQNSLKSEFKQRRQVISLGMLAPRKFLQSRNNVEDFKYPGDAAAGMNWSMMMIQINERGSALPFLESQMHGAQSLSKDLVLETLLRLKKLKKWNLVCEILEWLRYEQWWDFNKMDCLMLITAYGKLGDFRKAEMALQWMYKQGYPLSVISHTAMLEAYGKGGQFNEAEKVFRRMQSLGPEPSAVTYQIILKIFVEQNKFKEAEVLFETLLADEKAPLKPDQKMFHIMIYMYKKARSYDRAYKLFEKMGELQIPRSTVTYNSLMSFEENHKVVSCIYNEINSIKSSISEFQLWSGADCSRFWLIM